ncbi:MAG: hypothetical protein HGA84_02105 [Syntrophobacteraceae bacterium]|nr:hypothetical protein [Syntrophobacteraceae bacterium]
MPTPAELERLDALTRRLTVLAQVERGQLIRAEDWNAVVGALIEVARAVLAEVREGAVPDHEHTDQVTVGWLDPRLRALMEKGPLSEPSAVARVDGVDRRVGQALLRMTNLEDTLREVRTISSDVAARDVKRETDLNTLRRSVQGIPDAREDVLTLRDTLQNIQKDVRTAIEVGTSLRVNGAPFDAQAFADRVRDLESVKERLSAPDGTLFDAGALERRLAALINTFVTQEQLDTALEDRGLELSADQFAILEERVANGVSQRFDQNLASSMGTLRGEMTARFAEIDATVSRAVSDATKAMGDALLQTVRNDIQGAVSASRTEMEALVNQRIKSSEETLRGVIAGSVATLEGRVGGMVAQAFQERIAPVVEPLRADIENLKAQTAQNSSALAATNATVAGLSTRIDTVARADEQGRKTLQTSLLEEVDRRMKEQSASLETRISQVADQLRSEFKVAVNDGVRNVSSRMEEVALAVATREVNTFATKMRTEMQAIAREEIRPAMEEFRASVNKDIKRSIDAIPGMVSTEVNRATANIPELVRTEVNKTRPIRTGGGG